MADINLHNIFCHLTGDDNFLSTVIETNDKDLKKKKNKKSKFNLMANMVTEYVPLAPYERQNYSFLPNQVKSYLTPDYYRHGVMNVIDKNLDKINASFLSSLNILLRPDIYKSNLDEQIRNLLLLETFISHKIQRNYQIDKIKNTRKVQTINKELIKNLSEGKITVDVIQAIVNIFEINLLVFDLTKTDIYLYWARGYKYPYLNLFKNLYCMSYIQGNYEPLMTTNNNISKEQRKKMYIHILSNLSEIKCMPDINLSLMTLVLLNTWRIPSETYIMIIEKFYKKPKKSALDAYDELAAMQKKNKSE